MGASKFWKLFYLSSCKPHPHWYQVQCVSKGTMNNVQQKKKKNGFWCEKYIYFNLFCHWAFLLVSWTLLSSAGGNWKWDIFLKTWSWVDAFLSWKDKGGRINILRTRQRKRNALWLCVACWWGGNQLFFLNISLSL